MGAVIHKDLVIPARKACGGDFLKRTLAAKDGNKLSVAVYIIAQSLRIGMIGT